MPKNDANRETFHDPLKQIPRILSKLFSMWASATYPFAEKGADLSLNYTVDIRNPNLIAIGNSVIVHKDVWLHGVPSPENTGKPSLIIGDHCLIGRRSQISARNHVDIEADVIVSASVLIQDHGHAFANTAVSIREQGLTKGGRIRIGKGTWIGHGAAIVCNEGELVLGRNCVVASNALVTRSAPDFSVLSGNPARIVKQFDVAKGRWVLGTASHVSPELERIRLESVTSVQP